MTVEVLASARAGLESTRGTPVTPTRLLYHQEAERQQDVGLIMPSEAWANFTPFRRAYAGLERSGFGFKGDATFEQMILWLNVSVDAEASGSVIDTSGYEWSFLPVHTSDALKSATVEFGFTDLLSTVGWRLPGCIGNRLKVTWTKPVEGGETGVMYEVELMSAYGATQITAFTGSLSDVAMTSAIGNGTRTYLNGTGSAFGTTADTRINQATFEVDNGYVYRDGFDGTPNAIEIVRTKPRMSSLTFQRYFNDKTELDAFIAKTTRRLRILNEGAVVGAVTAKNTLRLDYAGVAKVHDQANSDGLIYANIGLEPLNDSSILSDFKWYVLNTSASIT